MQLSSFTDQIYLMYFKLFQGDFLSPSTPAPSSIPSALEAIRRHPLAWELGGLGAGSGNLRDT